MAWYKSRREAVLAGVKLTPQNREEAVLMGLVKPISENEVKLLEALKEESKTEKTIEIELREALQEEPKPKRKRTKKEE